MFNFHRGGLRNNVDARKLIVPCVKNETFASRSLSVAGPKLWNQLPIDIRSDLNTESFKTKLKTYLFQAAFNMGSDFVYY